MSPRARSAGIAQAAFLAAVETRLGQMSTSQLRKALLVWAEAAAPGDRARLLKLLGAKVEAAQDRVQRLAAELDWLEELAAGAGEPEWTEDDDWRDRYGWSPDDEEEDLNEPDWAPRFRDLLSGRRCSLCRW